MHTGHRGRVRERYEIDGNFDSFQDHQALEVLLFRALPRVDTNDLAHRLLNEFGSIKGVLEADYDILQRVEGVGKNVAFDLKLVLEIVKRYSRDSVENPVRYTNISQIGLYFYNKYIGVTSEQLYLMLFNNRMNLLDCVKVSEGSVTSTSIPLNKVNDLIVKKKAAAVVLAHNHPDGLAVPSQNDFDVTDTLRQLLESIDVTLVEHLIIAGNRFFPILKHRYGMFRTSPVSNRVERGFYDLFYDVDESEYTFPPIFREEE